MASIRYLSRPCILLFALGLAGCVAADDDSDDIDDLGELGDGKSDTVLPRSVELELAAGKSKRFRIKTKAFVASIDQAGDVDTELTAKHIELAFESDVSRAPRLEAVGDGTVRNWTLTVFNRGSAKLDATLVVDIPRSASELGIISDIDKTVLPPKTATDLPAPYPGIATLLTTLELRAGGIAGDVHFVTARNPEAVVEIPDWMAMHGVPPGTIDTGISGIPAVAQREKIADITRILEARVGQSFALFGDSSHRDPEVYAAIQTKFPGRISVAFIQKVTTTVSADRVKGMHLVNNYAEAAAILFGLDMLTEAEARDVMDTARAEGLTITTAEIDDLLDAQR